MVDAGEAGKVDSGRWVPPRGTLILAPLLCLMAIRTRCDVTVPGCQKPRAASPPGTTSENQLSHGAGFQGLQTPGVLAHIP